jgi:hypothetical protein
MATLNELLPYLEKGYTLQSMRGEIVRPLGGNMVAWYKAAGYRFQSEPEKYSLGQISAMSDMWSWGVAFTPDGKTVLIETEPAQIRQLIAAGVKGAAYGVQEVMKGV